jgi:hypothetical protein
MYTSWSELQRCNVLADLFSREMNPIKTSQEVKNIFCLVAVHWLI